MNINYPLPRGCSNDEYILTLLKAVNNVRRFAPELLIVSYAQDHAHALSESLVLLLTSFSPAGEQPRRRHLHPRSDHRLLHYPGNIPRSWQDHCADRTADAVRHGRYAPLRKIGSGHGDRKTAEESRHLQEATVWTPSESVCAACWLGSRRRLVTLPSFPSRTDRSVAEVLKNLLERLYESRNLAHTRWVMHKVVNARTHKSTRKSDLSAF